ncbi:hypothetical protein INT44_004980 [Umbelopsis vinacea]|uniref:SPX domain-containing protein n=1 Tax=Umbelopsis vinacea TaxID=44442 RepID=A0A8H7UL83_9FUNG|nr:hypothetical protein INT44_004980 [Umbelopsis vinacea]
MKFGVTLKENVFDPWRFDYLSYDSVKMDLKARQLDHKWNSADEAHFKQIIEIEFDKVGNFITRKQAELETRISYCERVLTSVANTGLASINEQTSQVYTSMNETLTEILFDVNDLSKFTRINYLAFQKIIKKHDKWTGLDARHELVNLFQKYELDNQRFDVVIVRISTLHDLCRLRGGQRTGDSAAGGDQNAFERATAKYWIHPDNITEVKAIILFHLPVLVFNQQKDYEASDSAISSVYYDNDNFDLYTGRLQRDEGAEAIRFRFYGPETSPNIFIERKTHHAPWLDGASVKDRFRLKEHQVNNFVRGKLTPNQIVGDIKNCTPEQADETNFIASGIQTSFKEKQLQPILRVFYNRTAFQLPGDQRLRLSLDTDMTFIREDHLDAKLRRPNNNWRRTDIGIDYPFSYVTERDILRFPYAVLETKIQTHLGQEPPQWLTRLLDSHLVHEVPRFSKYLHGASHFFKEQLPLLPWWLSEVSTDIRKERTDQFGLGRSKSFKPLLDGKYYRAQVEQRKSLDVGRTSLAVSTRLSVDHLKSTDNQNDLVLDMSALSKHDHFMSADFLNLGPSGSSTPNSMFRRDSATVSASLLPPYSSEKSSLRSGVGRIFPRRNKDDVEARRPSSPLTAHVVPTPIKKKDKEKKVKIEPKAFFANERTFISWLQFCALLLTTALNLLNFGDNVSRVSGAVFIAIAALLAIYAQIRYQYRGWQLRHQSTKRYDDVWGPAVLCVLLVGALVLNFYLRFGHTAL